MSPTLNSSLSAISSTILLEVFGLFLLGGGILLFLSVHLLLVVGLVNEGSLLPDLDDVVDVDYIVEQGAVVVQLPPLKMSLCRF